ncbi:MAG: methyl-accepting chemotaxis protein [Bacteroidota bacterium]
MNSFKAFLANMNITSKFLVRIGVTLGLASVCAVWFIAKIQNAQSENDFRERLTNLAVTLPITIHSAAEENATKLGMQYHRAPISSIDEQTEVGKYEKEAVEKFNSDASLSAWEKKVVENGVPKMIVFVPGRVRDECTMCHQSVGIDVFGDKKAGEIAAVFDISGPMTALYEQQAKTMYLVLSAGLGFILITGVIVWYFMKKLVTEPLSTIVKTAGAIALGDLTVNAPVVSRDEVGRLGAAVNEMVAKLRETIGSVQKLSSSVVYASTDISSSTEQMAAGAQEQSRQTNEVAGAIGEMKKTLVDTNKNIRLVADGARDAKENANAGGTVVGDTVKGMRNISEVVNSSADKVKVLGSSSEKIGEIINVIDEIADQTNLLALNAAIEAARAGEQGRGFAVVADEVRKLAERTSKATKEISMMVKQIQMDTKDAVASMDRGTVEVAKGITLAEKAGEMLRGIVGNAEAVAEMVSQIAAASEQQASTSEEISRNVEGISSVTNENANAVQQIARTAEDLNKMTENLQAILEKFTLEPSGQHSQQHTKERASRDRSTKKISGPDVHTEVVADHY